MEILHDIENIAMNIIYFLSSAIICHGIDFAHFIIGFSWPYQSTCTHICDDYWLEAYRDSGRSLCLLLIGQWIGAYFIEMTEMWNCNWEIIHYKLCFT